MEEFFKGKNAYSTHNPDKDIVSVLKENGFSLIDEGFVAEIPKSIMPHDFKENNVAYMNNEFVIHGFNIHCGLRYEIYEGIVKFDGENYKHTVHIQLLDNEPLDLYSSVSVSK